jgi:hypothetical protein
MNCTTINNRFAATKTAISAAVHRMHSWCILKRNGVKMQSKLELGNTVSIVNVSTYQLFDTNVDGNGIIQLLPNTLFQMSFKPAAVA